MDEIKSQQEPFNVNYTSSYYQSFEDSADQPEASLRHSTKQQSKFVAQESLSDATASSPTRPRLSFQQTESKSPSKKQCTMEGEQNSKNNRIFCNSGCLPKQTNSNDEEDDKSSCSIF